MVRTIFSPERERRFCPLHEGLSLIFSQTENRLQRFLAALWQNWPVIMGPELSALAFPLGHKDKTLIIGADDNMAMQELSLQSPEILERANAVMDCEFFSRIKVELLLGQRPLTARRPSRPVQPLRPQAPQRPPGLGKLHGKLNPDSPVAACYEAYLAMFDGAGGPWGAAAGRG